MEQQAALGEIARLEAIVGGDPGAPAFPALAEANRRAGRAKEAERVAREGLLHRPDALDGRVALALALLDQEREDEARHALERVLEEAPDHPVASAALPGPALEAADAVSLDALGEAEAAEIGDDELDRAFASAEANVDSMVSANDLAAQAMRVAELDEPEGVRSRPGEPSADADLPFATHTMADLLEQQGHETEAQEIRARAEQDVPDTVSGTHLGEPQRRRVIGTLERWLDHLRRARR